MSSGKRSANEPSSNGSGVGSNEIDTAVAHGRDPTQAAMTKLKDEYINETTPGMPAQFHPTVLASFVAVDDKCCTYTVNCNQAAPDERKMFEMQSSHAGVDNVGNGTLNDSKMALFLSVKPDKDDKQAEKKVSVQIYQ